MAMHFLGRTVRVLVIAAALGAAGYAMRDQLDALLVRHPSADASDALASAVRPAQPVRVTEVRFAAPEADEDFTGTIRPQHEAALSFRTAGQLVARLVEVGDRVKKGQVLARLDDTDARLDLEAAAAERAAAETDLARARAEAARSVALFAAGHIAKAALDFATTTEAEATSRADRAGQSYDLAANRLSYATLLAEADGIVTATLAEAGQVLSPGSPVLSVADTGALDVVFALPENRRDLIDSASASATLWGAAGESHALTLRDISPDVDPVGRTYRVRMTLVDPDAETTLGRTVTVQLRTSIGAPVVTLPLAAVLNDGSGPAVWHLPKGSDHVTRIAVELAGIDGQTVRVRGPLSEGDLVVSLGAYKLDPARPVRVVETAPTPES